MFDIIYRFFRNRRIRKYVSDVETGLIPLSSIKTANVVIDVEEPGFDVLKEDIMAWARNTGIKVNIYFFDFRRIGKDELLLTSITNTLLKKELDWTGMPDLTKVAGVIEEKSDLFISMVDNGNFPIDFLSKCAKARFKIGRTEYKGHVYDLVISGNQTAELRSDSRRIFAAVTDFLTKIK